MTVLLRVIRPHPLGWSVGHPLGLAIDLITTDPVLAKSVREELDRVDPLHCPHPADTRVQIRGPRSARVLVYVCGVCYSQFRGHAPEPSPVPDEPMTDQQGDPQP